MNSGQWAVNSGQWAVNSGQWAVNSGQWTVNSGQWAVDSGQWAVNSGQWISPFPHDPGSPSSSSACRLQTADCRPVSAVSVLCLSACRHSDRGGEIKGVRRRRRGARGNRRTGATLDRLRPAAATREVRTSEAGPCAGPERGGAVGTLRHTSQVFRSSSEARRSSVSESNWLPEIGGRVVDGWTHFCPLW